MESLRVFASLKQGLLPFIQRRAFLLDMTAFALALLLSRVEILSVSLPLGVAFVIGADMAGHTVYYPLTGAVIGTLLMGTAGYTSLFVLGLYMVLRILCPLLFKRLLRVDKLLMMAGAECMMLLVFYLDSVSAFLNGLSAVAIALLLALSFQNALRAIKGLHTRQRLYDEEQISICLLIGALALACAELAVAQFSLSIAIIAWTAMFAAYVRGLSAVAAAVALAGMLLLGGQGQPLLLADFALCSLFGVLLKNMGIWGVALGFTVCAGITETYFGVAGQQVGLINALPAAAIFVFIPKQGLLFLRASIDNSAREERTARVILKRLQEQTAEGITRTAQTVEQVADLFSQGEQAVHDPEREKADMMRAALNVCSGCAYRGSCWREKEAAMEAVLEMLLSYTKGIRPRPLKPLKSECSQTQAIAAASMQARDAYREKCMQTYDNLNQRAFINRQLHGVGTVMRTLSRDVREQKWPDEGSSQLLRRRLEKEGIPVKSALVLGNKRYLTVELRLSKRGPGARQIEEAVSRALEQSMRVLKTKETPRERLMELEQAQRVKVTCGAKTICKRGSALSGDSTGQANLHNGNALYVVSDGMGSGPQAQDKSKEAIAALIKLYEVGYARETALECLNKMLMRDGADMFATLDAVHLDLKTGRTEFIKCGAPPSFVLRQGKVHTIYAEALPAGMLDEATAAVHVAQLRRNDMVVLVTDGTLEALQEDTADEILRCVGGANTCEEAADSLLLAARERSSADDMTVFVLRLE